MTLAEYLLARFAEDERDAHEMSDLDAANWILLDREAKRRLVEDPATPRHIPGLLALPYADHPDYDPDWRP